MHFGCRKVGINVYERAGKYIGNYPGSNRIDTLENRYLNTKRMCMEEVIKL